MHLFFRCFSVASGVGFSVSSLCSLMRVSRVRFVSPMYLALQFLHVMEYTPLSIFCGSTLSFGLTSDLLMVL